MNRGRFADVLSGSRRSLSYRMKRALVTTEKWQRRYNSLGRIINSCNGKSKRKQLQLRDDVIDMIEAYHLPSVLQFLKNKLDQQADEDGDVDVAMYDAVQLLSLWMRMSGRVVLQQITDEYDGMHDDDEESRAYLQPHALYGCCRPLLEEHTHQQPTGPDVLLHEDAAQHEQQRATSGMKRPRLAFTPKGDSRDFLSPSRRLMHVLRNTKNWLKRYNSLARIIQSCDDASPQELERGRELVVEVIERYHLLFIFRYLRENFRMNTCDTDEVLVLDGKQLFTLWLCASGKPVRHHPWVEDCESEETDYECKRHRRLLRPHPLFLGQGGVSKEAVVLA